MNKELSNYLDIVRVIASFAVLFQHLSMYNNDVFPVFLNYGHFAVMGFFILSGYVIAFVAEQKEKKFDFFLKHRFARLYSVMVVAWILTVVLDTAGVFLNTAMYDNLVASDQSIIRTITHILFLQQSWFTSIQFFSNQPLWSLAYEFWYYILFGVIFLYKGKFKIGIIAIILLIMGPVIIIYSLIWFAGVLLYKLHQKNHQHNSVLSSLFFSLSVILIFSYPYWKENILPINLFEYGKLSLVSIIDDMIFGLLVAINIYLFKYTCFSFYILKPVISFFSQSSFSLYVFHFPLILFYKAILTKYFNLNDESLFIIITLLVLSSVHFLSFISERKKRPYFKFFDYLDKTFIKKLSNSR
jgi:peptidoglycan/LPS O-acetylase OafA/YrhL